MDAATGVTTSAGAKAFGAAGCDQRGMVYGAVWARPPPAVTARAATPTASLQIIRMVRPPESRVAARPLRSLPSTAHSAASDGSAGVTTPGRLGHPAQRTG